MRALEPASSNLACPNCTALSLVMSRMLTRQCQKFSKCRICAPGLCEESQALQTQESNIFVHPAKMVGLSTGE